MENRLIFAQIGWEVDEFRKNWVGNQWILALFG